MITKQDEDLVMVGIAGKGFAATSDMGASWHPLGDSQTTVKNRPNLVVFDPSNPRRYWESGIYGEGGVYETKDDGATFVRLGTNFSHTDVVTIDFTDPDRKLLLAGGHEMAQILHRSSDGGANWTDMGNVLPSDEFCTFLLIVTSNIHLAGCGGPFGHGGVFRSVDGSATWTKVAEAGGACPALVASDGAIYWAGPIGMNMVRSTDQGATWKEIPSPSYIQPIELPDGRLAAVRGPEVVVSADRGETWRTVTPPAANNLGSLTYSARQKAFYALSCGTGDNPPDVIRRSEFDYQTQ
jgi:photosystem II stability/assembly factor-like uncharacterized protein